MSAALCFVFVLLIPSATAGLALINAGLGRFRNAAHSMLSALCVIATAALVYFAIGAAWQGSAGQPAFAWHVGGQDWNWIGAGRFFLRGLELGGWNVTRQPIRIDERRTRRNHPLGQRRRSVATGRKLRFHRLACRLDLSVVCTLGLGRWMARAAGFHR